MSTTAYETMTLLGQCALSGTVYGVNPYQNVSFIPTYKIAITKALQKLYTEFNLKEDVLVFPSMLGGDFSLDAHTVIKPLQAEYSNGVGISINDLNDPYSAMLKQHDLMQLTVDSNVPSGYLSYQAYHASLDLLAGYVAPSMGTTNQDRWDFLSPLLPDAGGRVITNDIDWLYLAKYNSTANGLYASIASNANGHTVTLGTGEQYAFTRTLYNGREFPASNGYAAYYSALNDYSVKLFIQWLDDIGVYIIFRPKQTAYIDVPILLPVYLHNAFFALVSYYMLNTLTTSTDWGGAAGEMYREYKRNVELVKNSMLLRTQEESTNLVRRDLGWL